MTGADIATALVSESQTLVLSGTSVPTAPGFEATLTIEFSIDADGAARFALSDMCRNATGFWSVDDAHVLTAIVDSDVRIPLNKMCSEPLNAQGNLVLSLFESGPSVLLNGNDFTFEGPVSTATFVGGVNE